MRKTDKIRMVRVVAGMKEALRNGTFESTLDALRLSHEEWFAILSIADNELFGALQDYLAKYVDLSVLDWY